MKATVRAGTFILFCLAFLGVPAFAAGVDVYVVTQLACPVKVTKVVAVYGPAGAKYKPADYAHINPEGVDKFWVYGVFENTGEDTVTSFDFDILVWDAAGNEIFRDEGIFDFPLRDDPKSKEWSWVFDGAGLAAAVVFIPRVVTYPASRKWEADEKYIDAKIAELRQAGQP